MKNKSILFVTPREITSNSGGVQRVTETLSEEFIRRGYIVTYLVLAEGTSNSVNGIQQFFLPENFDSNSESNSVFLQNLLSDRAVNIIINQIGFSLRHLYFLSDNIMSHVKLFTVHHNCIKCLNDQYQNIYKNTLAKKKLKYLLDNKIGWFFLRKLHKIRFRKVIEKTIDDSDKLILLFDEFKNELLFYTNNYDTHKVCTISNPSPYEIHQELNSTKENKILYVGRLNYEQKRADLMMKIWEKIYKDFPNWSLDILGDGPLRSELEEKAKQLERICFHGKVDPIDFYKKSKILCSTSTFEGFGMIFLEAYAFGVIPISFKSFSAIEKVIENQKTGILVEQNNLDKFINELKSLMLKDAQLEKYRLNSSAVNNEYKVSEIVNKWESLFEA